ncbi:hypothetical protein [Kineococcus rhizosphaerae]|uniref:Excreted virulence factor EspC (Type VII ESX diderm) n=1 Tax=Kineococcus rhizosphaerae TaxID=559628 RepID=A0A2T0QX25_9ACTN|nr:hypothetical protein [Kineococcus rhizosphaerae]PRY10270.1 hypothetical protein CLV37_11744 [Kineococcus rhizosphaerae]
MAFAVTTEELGESARSLRTDGEHQQRSERALRDGANQAPSWAVGRACRAVQAFFDTIGDASQRSGTGLTGLGDRLGVAAGEYDDVEYRLTPG